MDANAGTTTYQYDVLGQLTSQTSAKGETHTMQYNLLGQVTTRSGPEGTTSYQYGSQNGSNERKNQIKKVIGFVGGNETEYHYDGYGRVNWMNEKVDNTDHISTYSYNTYGDLTQTNYPGGFVEKSIYDGNGYLTNIRNNADQNLYSLGGMNGQGQVTSYSLGNGKSSTIEYSNLMPRRFTTDGIQDLRLEWDYAKGNLTKREDARKNKEETFSYDNLDRLTGATISGQTQTISYASNGNISSKTDAGTYSYHASKFNAVTGVNNPSAVIPSQQQDITYTVFQQPYQVTEGQYELTYTYGADYNRIKSVTKQNGNVTNTRYYFGGFEKDITGGTTRYIQYISSPVGLVAIVENNNVHYTYTGTPSWIIWGVYLPLPILLVTLKLSRVLMGDAQSLGTKKR